jgi:hypothetical protein
VAAEEEEAPLASPPTSSSFGSATARPSTDGSVASGRLILALLLHPSLSMPLTCQLLKGGPTGAGAGRVDCR